MKDFLDISRFNRQTHRPCLYLSIIMATGIALGQMGFWNWTLWSLLCGLSIGMSLVIRKGTVFFLYLAILCLGAFHLQSTYIFPANHLAFLNYFDQKKIEAVEGVIDAEVQIKTTAYGTKQVFEFKISRLRRQDTWQEAHGRILVHFFQKISINYGETWMLEGALYKVKDTNESDKFSYQQYLEKHGIFFNWSVGKARQVAKLSSQPANRFVAASLKLKNRFKQVLAKYLEPEESSVIQAMVLGDRSLMTKDVYALFSKTGTSHILAISGMNMAIISAIFLFLLKVLRVPRMIQFMMTALFLLFYAFLSGWSASVVRSVLMATVLLSSFCLEQETDTTNSLGIAAIILFLLDPQNLFDVGFQLSFLSVGMIVYTHPLICGVMKNSTDNRFYRGFIQAFLISLVAWFATIGLVAYQFEMVSPIAILANIPIVVLADLIILLSLGLVMIGLCSNFLAIAFAGTLKLVFNFTLFLTSWFSQVPGAYFYIHGVTSFHVLLYYFFVIIVYLIVRAWMKRIPL